MLNIWLRIQAHDKLMAIFIIIVFAVIGFWGVAVKGMNAVSIAAFIGVAISISLLLLDWMWFIKEPERYVRFMSMSHDEKLEDAKRRVAEQESRKSVKAQK